MSTCTHEEFEAHVTVNRLEDIQGFAADVHITCRQCGKPFQFLGLPGGLAPDRPTVSVDWTEARLPIQPAWFHTGEAKKEPRKFDYPSGFSLSFHEGGLE